FRARDVGRHRERPRPRGRFDDRLLERLGPPAREGDAVALLQQRDGRRASDAGPRSRHDRNPVRHVVRLLIKCDAHVAIYPTPAVGTRRHYNEHGAGRVSRSPMREWMNRCLPMEDVMRKTKLIAAALGLCAASAFSPAFAAVSVYVDIAPPPPRYEVIPGPRV